MAFTNAYLGAVHAFSEVNGGFHDIPHGTANSIFLPYVTEFNMSVDYEKHGKLANCIDVDVYGLTDKETSEKGVKRLFELIETLNIPKLGELDIIKPEAFKTLSELCYHHNCGKKEIPKKCR